MYLRANDKASGVENFHSAVGSKLIRRELVTKALRQGLIAAARPGSRRNSVIQGAGEAAGRGLLGTGQQGLRLLAAVNPAFISVKSIADLRPSNRSIGAARGWQKDVSTSIRSYEELLAAAKADGLEAVIIALPSHLHAPAALAALEAGLHVFVETPMALSVADAKKVARKAAEKNLILAVGQQRRYNWIYDHALEMVRLDLLDQVHYIRSQWHVAKPEKKAARRGRGGQDGGQEESQGGAGPASSRSIGGRKFPRTMRR